MILADTSVWLDHLRTGDDRMSRLLREGVILLHPFVLGEVALGHLNPRAAILRSLRALPQAEVADANEVLDFVDRYRLIGVGLGYVDVHLLVAAALSLCRLWTRDKRLHAIAKALGVAAEDLH